ncbi:MAG: hypothetical protein AB1696_20050 [Planctomycetota bacterium]
MRKNYRKAVKRKLRELAVIAYERELGAELEKLARKFDEWREKKIDAFELTDIIHKFHNGPAREMWKSYTANCQDLIVAGAVNRGVLKREEIPEDVLQEIGQLLDTFSMLESGKKDDESAPRCRGR